jgi:hypothetical protein
MFEKIRGHRDGALRCRELLLLCPIYTAEQGCGEISETKSGITESNRFPPNKWSGFAYITYRRRTVREINQKTKQIHER